MIHCLYVNDDQSGYPDGTEGDAFKNFVVDLVLKHTT